MTEGLFGTILCALVGIRGPHHYFFFQHRYADASNEVANEIKDGGAHHRKASEKKDEEQPKDPQVMEQLATVEGE